MSSTDIADAAIPATSLVAGRPAAKKLSKFTALGYGAGTVIGDWVFMFIASFLLFFMTGQLGVNAGVGGAVVAVATFVGAFSQPLMGIFSDTRTWKHGRRGPFILWGGLVLAVAFVLLFVDWGLNGTTQLAYLFVMVVVVELAYGAQAAPYGAMVPELTEDYDQRTTLTTVRGMFTSAIGVVGYSLPLATVAAFTGWFAISEKSSWTLMVAVITGVALVLNVFCWSTTHRHELMAPVEKQSIGEILGAAIRNRTFRTVALMYAVNGIGQAVFTLIMVYFLFDYLGFSEGTASLFFLAMGLSALVWVPVNGWLAQKLDKRRAMYIAGTVTLVCCLLILLVTPNNAWLMWVLTILGSMGMMGAVVIPYSMLADCVEVDEYRSGVRREGLFYSSAMMLMQLFMAAAIWVTGMVLNWTGYVSGAMSQPSSAIWGIRLLEAGVIAVTSGLTVLLAWRVPLTREKYDAVLKAMEAKKQGLPVDESSFADVF